MRGSRWAPTTRAPPLHRSGRVLLTHQILRRHVAFAKDVAANPKTHMGNGVRTVGARPRGAQQGHLIVTAQTRPFFNVPRGCIPSSASVGCFRRGPHRKCGALHPEAAWRVSALLMTTLTGVNQFRPPPNRLAGAGMRAGRAQSVVRIALAMDRKQITIWGTQLSVIGAPLFCPSPHLQ